MDKEILKRLCEIIDTAVYVVPNHEVVFRQTDSMPRRTLEADLQRYSVRRG
jgi:hypothetical protein